MKKRSRNLLLFSWPWKKKNVETEKEPPKVYSALEVARHIVNCYEMTFVKQKITF